MITAAEARMAIQPREDKIVEVWLKICEVKILAAARKARSKANVRIREDVELFFRIRAELAKLGYRTDYDSCFRGRKLEIRW